MTLITFGIGIVRARYFFLEGGVIFEGSLLLGNKKRYSVYEVGMTVLFFLNKIQNSKKQFFKHQIKFFVSN